MQEVQSPVRDFDPLHLVALVSARPTPNLISKRSANLIRCGAAHKETDLPRAPSTGHGRLILPA
jgi:hypothetical protein